MKIKYINYGTGNRIGNVVYLNKKLKKIPVLHDALLKHELKHSDNWNFGDFMQDLSLKEISGLKSEYYRFIIKNPDTWCNFSPIMKIEGKWTFDLSISIVWGFFFALSIFLGFTL